MTRLGVFSLFLLSPLWAGESAHLHLRMRLGGDILQSKYQDILSGNFTLLGNVDGSADNWGYNLRLVSKFTRGSVKSSLSFSNMEGDDNSVKIDNAQITYTNSYFQGRWGLLNFKTLNSPNFVTNALFLASRWHFNLGRYCTLSMVQSVPTGVDKSLNDHFMERGISSFFTERVDFLSKYISLYVQHFAFFNLSNSSAYYSLFGGNSVYAHGVSASEYAYKFYGWNGGIEFKYNDIALAYHIVFNRAALHFSHLLEMRAVVEEFSFNLQFFRNDSDVLPALYTNYTMGMNRYGVLFSLGWERDRYFSRIDLAVTKLVNNVANIYQSDENTISYYIGRKYDIL